MQTSRRFYSIWAFLLVIATSAVPLKARAADPISWSRGQTVYVPAYSHIYMGDRKKPFYLTATLVIRNSDPSTPITVTSANYIDSSGRLVRRFLSVPLIVRPLSSLRYVIDESDKVGGSGASFLVNWKSAARVSQPVVESIMIGTGMQQGISFTSRGQVVRETTP